MKTEITIRQMRGFLQVVRSGSITRAAGELGLTQSGLSLLIASLERGLGHPLFDRSQRIIRLLDRGRALLPLAQRIIEDVDLVLQDRVGSRCGGRVSVAALPTLAAALLPSAIARLGAMAPQTSVTVVDALTEEIVVHVRSGRAQIGIGAFLGRDADLILEMLFSDRLVALMPEAHQLAGRRSISWSQIASVDLILMSHDSNIRGHTDRAFLDAGRTVRAAYEVAYISTAVAFVREGLGVAIVPQLEADSVGSDRIVAVPLTAPVVRREIGLLTRRLSVPTPATQAFIKAIREGVADRRELCLRPSKARALKMM